MSNFFSQLKERSTQNTLQELRESGYTVDFNNDSIVVLLPEPKHFNKVARIANNHLKLYKYCALSTTKKEIMFHDCNDGGWIATITKANGSVVIQLQSL